MKMILKPILSSVALAFCLFLRPAYADTIANWTFESLTLGSTHTNTPPDGWLNNVAPETGMGAASGFHAATNTLYSAPGGNGSDNSISANRWAVDDYYQFTVSTIGFKAISLSYDQASSPTGPASFQFSYSANGTDFTPFGSAYAIASNNWTSVSFDLGSVTDLDNQSSVYFRIVDVSTIAINGSSVGTSGTDRIDNFIVTAALVPEPSIVTLGVVGGLTCLIAGRRKH